LTEITVPGFIRFFLHTMFGSTCDVILLAQGKVASVNTFAACCDVLKTSSPAWALFENVTSIDREVDPETNLRRSYSFIHGLIQTYTSSNHMM
jgi:hypothetical protein